MIKAHAAARRLPELSQTLDPRPSSNPGFPGVQACIHAMATQRASSARHSGLGRPCRRITAGYAALEHYKGSGTRHSVALPSCTRTPSRKQLGVRGVCHAAAWGAPLVQGADDRLGNGVAVGAWRHGGGQVRMKAKPNIRDDYIASS